MMLSSRLRGQLDALLGFGERRLDISRHERGQRAVEKCPRKSLDVVEQPRPVDGVVEYLGGLRHPTLHPERRSQHGRDQWEELSLAGCASDRERALGVTARLEAIEVHLRGRQVDERVEAAGQLLVGQLVDQLRRLVALCLRFSGTVASEAAAMARIETPRRSARRSSSTVAASIARTDQGPMPS